MKNLLNYYELLEVRPNATNEEIIKAYKKKAIEYHPDKNDGHHTANKLFQFVQEAKEVLTDPDQRLQYDYLAGIKTKPEPEPKTIYVPVKEKTMDTKALLAAGAVGLLVGIFLAKGGKK